MFALLELYGEVCMEAILFMCCLTKFDFACSFGPVGKPKGRIHRRFIFSKDGSSEQFVHLLVLLLKLVVDVVRAPIQMAGHLCLFVDGVAHGVGKTAQPL